MDGLPYFYFRQILSKEHQGAYKAQANADQQAAGGLFPKRQNPDGSGEDHTSPP